MKKDKEWLKQQLVKYYPSQGEIDNPDYEVIAKVEIIDEAFKLINQLDEPEQVVCAENERTTVVPSKMETTTPTVSKKEIVVPQFVGDYIEKMKEDRMNIFGVITSASFTQELFKWCKEKDGKLRYETLCRAWLDGYTIEQPKLLTVIVKDCDKTIMSKQMPEDDGGVGMKVSEERKYVLVSKKWSKATLLFWGTVTNDEEKRSFGGYTDDLRTCERYSLAEVKKFSKFDFMEFHKEINDTTFYATVEELIECFREPALSISL